MGKKGGFSTACIVYFVQVRGGGPVKIGARGEDSDRLLSLRTACPFPLDVVCEIQTTYFAEAFLHRLQKGFWLHGEWFEPNPALDAIMAHISEHGTFPENIAAELEMLWEVREADKAAVRLRRAARQTSHAKAFYEPSLETRKIMRAAQRNHHERLRATKGRKRRFDYHVVATQKSIGH